MSVRFKLNFNFTNIFVIHTITVQCAMWITYRSKTCQCIGINNTWCTFGWRLVSCHAYCTVRAVWHKRPIYDETNWMIPWQRQKQCCNNESIKLFTIHHATLKIQPTHLLNKTWWSWNTIIKPNRPVTTIPLVSISRNINDFLSERNIWSRHILPLKRSVFNHLSVTVVVWIKFLIYQYITAWQINARDCHRNLNTSPMPTPQHRPPKPAVNTMNVERTAFDYATPFQ